MVKKVLNLRDSNYIIPENAVYIGRDNPKLGLKDIGLGNPFIIGRDGSRKDVIRKFRDLVYSSKKRRERIRQIVNGKSVVCWCAPEPCHGDVTLEIDRSNR